MNPQETFEAWKARRSQTDLSQGFTDRVMAGIRCPRTKHAGRLMLRLRSAAAQPWARAAAVITGTLLGLVRIVLTLHLILFA